MPSEWTHRKHYTIIWLGGGLWIEFERERRGAHRLLAVYRFVSVTRYSGTIWPIRFSWARVAVDAVLAAGKGWLVLWFAQIGLLLFKVPNTKYKVFDGDLNQVTHFCSPNYISLPCGLQMVMPAIRGNCTLVNPTTTKSASPSVAKYSHHSNNQTFSISCDYYYFNK